MGQHKRRTSLAVVFAAAAMAFVLTACSQTEEDTSAGPTLPAGTELGQWGDTLQVNESIQLVLGDAAGGDSGTVVRLQVVEVRQGEAADLESFSGVRPNSTPWYVSIAQHNRGPADLDLTAEQGWFLRLDTDLELPPTEVQGQFTDCPSESGETSLPAAAERLDCLVFLVAEGETPKSVDYLRHDGFDSVQWRIPSGVGVDE